MRQATKQDEHDVLFAISELISKLGPDSYVGAAFEGCMELAQQNIANDELLSVHQRWMSALRDCEKKELELKAMGRQIADLEAKVAVLQKQLETEQEWMPYVDMNEVSDAEYKMLESACDKKCMRDDDTKDFLSELCGFHKERVEICHSKPIYEVNRHKVLRVNGVLERHPYYYASDWNYIRFKCGGYTWELNDGELRNVS